MDPRKQQRRQRYRAPRTGEPADLVHEEAPEKRLLEDGRHEEETVLLPLFLWKQRVYAYYRFQRYAFPLLIALLWVVPAVFQVDPIGAYFSHTVDPVFNLLVPR